MSSESSIVLVVDSEGTNLGQMSKCKAEILAENQGLDLILVNKTSNKETYKIMDRGKWAYEQKKRQKAKKYQPPPMKEVRFSMRIDEHDKHFKVERAKMFLDKGSPVKISLKMRGRERNQPDVAKERLLDIIGRLGDVRVGDMQISSSWASVVIRRP